jgi:hypothetical protein
VQVAVDDGGARRIALGDGCPLGGQLLSATPNEVSLLVAHRRGGDCVADGGERIEAGHLVHEVPTVPARSCAASAPRSAGVGGPTVSRHAHAVTTHRSSIHGWPLAATNGTVGTPASASARATSTSRSATGSKRGAGAA